MEEPEWVKTYQKILGLLEKHDKNRRFNFKGNLAKEFEKLREEFRDSFIEYILGTEVNIAKKWINNLLNEIEALKKNLSIDGVLFSKELRSFIEDPYAHLRKKIFNYMYDLFRLKIDIEEFEQTAGAALRTSLRTNMRSIYQGWVIAATLNLLAEEGGYIIYPEHKYISFERSGKQKLGWIPPNMVMYIEGRGFISLFIEAPRPIGWEDTQDLKRAWRFYTALRPDILVYGGKILNIVKLGQDPPIERPHMIIECKELEDWYVRMRDMRGPFAKPLTAEEWRSKWIQGLWDGLADILGVKRTEAVKTVKERKTLRLKEPQILALYRKFYNPDVMVLVSRSKIPEEVVETLKENRIEVIDNVGYNRSNLRELIEILLKIAKHASGKISLEISWETYAQLKKLSRVLKMSKEELLKKIIKYALTHKDDIYKVK